MILAIYGSGGQGRHTLDLAKQIDSNKSKWSEIIFVDDFKPFDGAVVNGHLAMPFDAVLNKYPSDGVEYVVGVGEPANREALYQKLVKEECRFAKLIHPSVYVPDTTSIGEGCVICQFSIVDCNAHISDNVYMSTLASIGHDSQIGRSCFIASGSKVAGNCKVGSEVYVGQNAAIKEGLTVGDNVIVSQAAAVFRDIEEELIVVGNPARPSRKNEGGGVFGR